MNRALALWWQWEQGRWREPCPKLDVLISDCHELLSVPIADFVGRLHGARAAYPKQVVLAL